MEILNKIENNTILIIPKGIKKKILEEINKKSEFIKLKIMDLNEFKKHYFFDYDFNAILFLMDKYRLNVDTSKEILELIYIIDNQTNDNNKLNFLANIKNELNKNDLLYYDILFKNYISTKKIFVYGYTKLSKFDEYLLKKVNAKFIEEKQFNKQNKIFVFDTLEEEVEYVFHKISMLIESGIKLSKIKIVNFDSKYNYSFERYSKIFNIPIRLNNNNIYSTNICKCFLKHLKETKNISGSIKYICEKINLSNESNLKIYDLIFEICNKYNDLNYSFESVYSLIKTDIKNTTLSDQLLNEELTIERLENNFFLEDEYVFLLGFDQASIPKLYKDEDYIEDNIKIKYKLLLYTTEEKNMRSKESVIKSINKINNLIITTKKKNISEEFSVSNLSQDLNYKVDIKKIDLNKSYSELNLKVKLVKYLDDFIKYDLYNENISSLYNNTKIKYLTYSNEFNGIDNSSLIEYLKKGLLLSYTSLDNYYHCAFKYYISNILKIDIFEESFSTIIGSFFHYILSICYKDKFDFDYEYDLYMDNLILTNKDKFFLSKLKNELRLVVEQVKILQNETGLTDLLLEHKIIIDKSTIIPVSFVGIVDKIMYKEKNNETLVSIIDYKTGKADIDLYNVIYGLSMQLPIYLYIVEKSNLFNNVKFTGFYLQKILSSEVGFSLTKTYKEQKMNNLKLIGYSNCDISKLEIFIPDYENSRFVKSMKTTTNGFSHYTKVLSDKQIENLIDIVDKNIDSARDNILKGNFEINPKQIGTERIGCNFCKFKDICYKTNNDYKIFKENKSLRFIGGDENA